MLISAEGWANLISALGVFTAAVFFIHNTQRETRAKRSEIIRGLTDYSYGNEALNGMFMDLLYDSELRIDTAGLDRIKQQPMTPDNLVLRESDKRMSLLLDYLNSVCYLIETNVLDERTICGTVLGFIIAKTWRHSGVQAYIAWIDTPSSDLGQQKESFEYLRRHSPRIIRRMYPHSTAR
jgi:hypothetical protein